MNHGIFEGFKEVLLELKMEQLLFFQKSHRQLTEGVQREESDMRIAVTANL